MSKQNPFNDNNYKQHYGSQLCRDDCPSKNRSDGKCPYSCCVKCPLGPVGPRGPAGNAAALTITPLAGGTRPISAHLVITQIQ